MATYITTEQTSNKQEIINQVTPNIVLDPPENSYYLLQYRANRLTGPLITPVNFDNTIVFGACLPSLDKNDPNTLFMTPNVPSHHSAISLFIMKNIANHHPQKQNDKREIIIDIPYPEIQYKPTDVMPLSIFIDNYLYEYGLRTQWNLTQNVQQVYLIFLRSNTPFIGNDLVPDIILPTIKETIYQKTLEFEEIFRDKGLLITNRELSIVASIAYT